MLLSQPDCPTGMASPTGVMAQRRAQLQPLLFAPLWQDWLLRSPLMGAHPCVCTAPCSRWCERLCSHIPQRPRPVQRQPSLGMTWIHFKLAVIHPGLAPGLSAYLPAVLPAPRPLSCGHSRVLGLPGAACSPALSFCPWSRLCLLTLRTVLSWHSQPWALTGLSSSRQGGSWEQEQCSHSSPGTPTPAPALHVTAWVQALGQEQGMVRRLQRQPLSTPWAPAAWITAASPHTMWPQRKHMSRAFHTTLMQKPRKTGTAARAGHQHYPSPRDFIPLT